MSTFTGFSEEDVKRIKSDSGASSEFDPQFELQPNIRRVDKIGAKIRKPAQYKTPKLNCQLSDESVDNLSFDKCRLSLKSPISAPEDIVNSIPDNIQCHNNNIEKSKDNESLNTDPNESCHNTTTDPNGNKDIHQNNGDSRKNSFNSVQDTKTIENYSDNELAASLIKLEELQLKQKLIQEQNKRRKEMLARALADRTKQTTEEVQRLEKIKNELQILDGQFSHDVAMLRKKIDLACLSYAEAEKHYLKIEKEFLHAKIQLQKEREKKELLTEHLCALITHNETRKAQKLETLMHQLVEEKISSVVGDLNSSGNSDKPVIVDGVDERTGKIVEMM